MKRIEFNPPTSEPLSVPPTLPETSRASFNAAAFWRGALIALVLLWLYSDVLRRLATDWWIDENYSHGLLLPFISGYAIWSLRDQLNQTQCKPQRGLGTVLMLAAVFLLLAGTVGAEFYISRVSFILALASLTLYFFGVAHLRLLVFPLGLFLLAIPIPAILFNQIAFPLQLIASDYAARTINLLGIPALREGNVIELANMKLQVVEACSGIRSLMALATLSVTYAYFAESYWWRRIVLVAAVIPIAIIANAARVAGTGVMAHYKGVEAAEGFMHSFSGWLVFIVAMLMLLAVARVMNFTASIFKRARTKSSPTDLSSPASKSAVN